MGYNTTVVILNDAVHHLDQDPEFPKRLRQAIQQAGARNPEKPIDVPIFGHVNAVQVVACAHADQQQVLAVGGNSGHVIGTAYWSNSEHRLLARLAEEHGFRLVRDRRLDTGKTVSSSRCTDCKIDAPYGRCLDCKEPLMKMRGRYMCPNDMTNMEHHRL